ncbi:uncharacterized protein N0V96_001478 [Colletotrichum fioriniae]|uniref:uncharacterized protein n=1 Tax=Colletotrichum fioriniae TaxID=710243 RepID=UPI0032DB7A09|nr:hypothetical protein N0V96_001478 [Colletotrichum fioriniae]
MQTLAPIHLLPRRDGSLDHWRGGLWGMNNPAAYTPLESLFLFQAILKHGVEAPAFIKVSDLLVNNSLIKDDKTYDAKRLSPDALRQLFLHLLQEELRIENATTDKPDGASPTLKKRKLSHPPLPTLKEVKEQSHRFPALVDRLYARYKENVVRDIREDERRIETLARDIKILETQEAIDRAKANTPRPVAPNGPSAPKPVPTPVPVPSLIPTPGQTAAQNQAKRSTPTPPVETPRPIRPANGQGSVPTQTPVPIPRHVPLQPQAHPRPPATVAPAPPPTLQPAPARRDVAPPAGAFQPSPTVPPAQAVSAAGASVAAPASGPDAKQHQNLKPPNSAAPVLQPPAGAGHPPVRPAQRVANTPIPPPQTPVTAPPSFLLTGSGTKWTVTSTPSTPRPGASDKEVASPAFEPLSPVQQVAPLPPAPTPTQASRKPSPKPTPVPIPVPKSETKTPGPRGRGRPPRSAHKVRADSTPSVAGTRRSQSVTSQTDELSMDHHELAPRIKDENATPRVTPRATPKPQDDTGDTTADESVPSRRNMITPSSVSSRLAHKRKRQDTPTEPLAPPTAPTHVLWTRQFGRVSAAALDQIGAHRFANQFANPIRERDAPGYKTLIIQPQDIKSIRAAITHGNRAATEAAKALPDGDPGTGSVLLPISDDLVPPKSIINSAQLERELVHMFSNAIMYNLNPSRGPGPAFMKGGSAADGADVVGYEVDEDAVVRSTRMMSMEVEKIIGELRNAEKERTGQAPSNSGNTRPASVATGEDTPMAEDDVDELAGDADITSSTRRRRVGTRN